MLHLFWGAFSLWASGSSACFAALKTASWWWAKHVHQSTRYICKSPVTTATTPFCSRFWPMSKTVLNGLHIEGTTSCHFAIKIRYSAKLIDDPPSQLVIDQNFQHSTKHIDIGQNDSSLIKTVRHLVITDRLFDKTFHVYFVNRQNTSAIVKTDGNPVCDGNSTALQL